MTKILTRSTLLGFALVAASAVGGIAFGQVGGSSEEYYKGTASGPGCPTIGYVFRGLSAKPYGYVWFQNASGVSKATGTMDMATGKFQLTLTSLDGNGPTGTVTGTKNLNTGQVTAVLNGPGCSNVKIGGARSRYTDADNGHG